MGLITLQDIFAMGSPDYERAHPLPAHVRKAARAIIQCRTAALGSHVHACPDGHVRRIWYHSCRHRSCPQCAFLQGERWLATQRARLLTCDHSHVILTLPHDRNRLWREHVAPMTSLLFTAVRDTLLTLLADPKYLGAQPGIIAALPTWGQTLVLHPPIPCLVTDGGLTPDDQWQPVRNGCFLPVRVAMAVCRGTCRAALCTAWERGDLTRPQTLRPQAFLNLLNRLGHPKKTRWNVHIQERSPHGTGVATSLVRSRRGGPITHARLVACDGETVTCRSSENHTPSGAVSGRPQQMTLSNRGRSAPGAPACAAARDAGGAVVGPLPSAARRRADGLPGADGAAARHRASTSRLADRVRPAWGHPHGTVPHLRPALGVHRGHPSWGCLATSTA